MARQTAEEKEAAAEAAEAEKELKESTPDTILRSEVVRASQEDAKKVFKALIVHGSVSLEEDPVEEPEAEPEAEAEAEPEA